MLFSPMETKPNTPSPAEKIVAYTQHENVVRMLERLCGVKIILLNQNRSVDPVRDILSQLSPHDQSITLLVVLPIDKLIQLREQLPKARIILMQLDAQMVEKVTGQPYNPKTEYAPEVVKQALRLFEIKGGAIRPINGVEELRALLHGKTVAVFNDVVRTALSRLIPEAHFVKTCQGSDCIEVNPPANRAGVRISFPGTTGRLDVDQMAELIKNGTARIYFAEVETQEVPLCPQ